MISIITGDIMHSRSIVNQQQWIDPLKEILNRYGKQPLNWEIFRGDSFQLEITRPAEAFSAALLIKSCIKQLKGLDVRLAIGVGEKNYRSERITESNGTAFIYSGELFEELKQSKLSMGIRTPWKEENESMNLLIKLGLMAMDNWTPPSAEIVFLALKEEGVSQLELAEELSIYQSSVSERQKRAYLSNIRDLDEYMTKRLTKLTSL